MDYIISVGVFTAITILGVLGTFVLTGLTGLFSLVQVLAYVLICAALLKLRTRPEVVVPGSSTFRIPLGRAGLFLMMLPTFVITLFVMAQRIVPDGVFNLKRTAFDMLVFASGPLTYLLFRRRRNFSGTR